MIGNAGFFGGAVSVYAFDKFVPHFHGSGEFDFLPVGSEKRERIKNAGVLTSIEQAFSNFPEGIAVFATALSSLPRTSGSDCYGTSKYSGGDSGFDTVVFLDR